MEIYSMMNSFHVPTHSINISTYGYIKEEPTILENIKENHLNPSIVPNIRIHTKIIIFWAYHHNLGG